MTNLILLTSNDLLVTKIKRKTEAFMFKNIQKGDILKVSIPISYAGGSRGSTYASHMKIENKRTGESTNKTFNQLPRYLEHVFEVKEIIEEE